MAVCDEAGRYRLGVDIGGTFTDIVVIDDHGTVFSKKLLSTPHDYSEGIEAGVRDLLSDLGVPATSIVEFVHATTVATNTIIERKGAEVALVTTAGFRDVLEIARFRTPRLYDIHYRKHDPLVPRERRFAVAADWIRPVRKWCRWTKPSFAPSLKRSNRPA